jgi:hypothetical protein
MVVCAVRYEPVSAPVGPDKCPFTGNFRRYGPVPRICPCFGSNDQRLRGKFPTFVNREDFSDIRPSSRDNSQLLQKIREAQKQPFLARGLLVQHPYHTDGRGFTPRLEDDRRQNASCEMQERPGPRQRDVSWGWPRSRPSRQSCKVTRTMRA